MAYANFESLELLELLESQQNPFARHIWTTGIW